MPWVEGGGEPRPRVGVLLGAFLDLIYPRDCMACSTRLSGADGECLCGSCLGAISRIGADQCPRCGDALGPHSTGRQACGSCRERGPLFFRGATAACRYETVAREMVHRLKYAGDLRAVGWMAREMIRKLRQTEWFSRVGLIVPVPLHWTRHVARRFNQSELLARHIAAEDGKVVQPRVLRRNRKTVSQSVLSTEERAENVRGAFRVVHPERVKGEIVLLVDDVMTTCATAAECARTLLKGGARTVYVVTFAR